MLLRDDFAIPANLYFVGLCLGDTIFYSGNIGISTRDFGTYHMCENTALNKRPIQESPAQFEMGVFKEHYA